MQTRRPITLLRARWPASLICLLALLLVLRPAGTRAQGQPLRWHTFTADNGLAGNIVQAFWEDEQGAIWLGTENGVSRYDGRAWRTYRIEDGLIDNNIWSISGDADSVWCATNSGLSVLRNGIWSSYTTADGLPGNDVRAVLVARDGTVWAGTFGQGLARLTAGSRRWEALPFLADPTGQDEFVQGIWQGAESRVWVATNGAGAVLLRGEDVQYFNFRVDGRNTVWAIHPEATTGRAWMATFQGIMRIDSDDGATPVEEVVQGIPLGQVEVLAAGGLGDELWFGTRSHGVFHQSGGRWERFTSADGLGRNYVTALYVDRANRVWFGTRGGGVTLLDRRPLPAEALHPTVLARSLPAEADVPVEAAVFDFAHNDLQLSLALDAAWLPPQDIAFRYRLEREDGTLVGAAHEQRAPATAPRVMSEPYVDLPPGSYTLHITPLIGASAGPEQSHRFHIRSAPPSLQPETLEVSAMGQPLEPGLTLPQVLFQTTRPVQLRFSALDDQTPPAELQYFYRLVGEGDSWRPAGGPAASLQLPEGTHRIEVQARDGEGNSSEPISMTVIVPQPLWTTLLIYLLLLLLPSAAGGVAGALGYRRWARRQALRKAVGGAFNPYDVGPTITVADRYIGRQHVLDTILGKIDNNSFYVYGEKRIGKTSLLLQIKQRLGQRNDVQQRRLYLPVFRNIQDLPEQQFWLYLVRSITAELEELPPGLAAYAGQEAGYDDLDAEQDIERILEHLERGGREPRIVLLIDEVDTLQRYDQNIRQRFRAFCQHAQRSLGVVLAGVLPPSAESGETSPWYNIYERVVLGPLGESDTRYLIRSYNHNPYAYAPEAEQLILEAGDGKPFDTQWLCSEAVKSMLAARRTAVSPEDARRAVRVVLDERRAEYVACWQQLAPALQEELRHAAAGERALRPGRSDYDQLVESGLAQRTAEGYRITALFQRWLQE